MMTKEEYEKKIDELQAQIDELKNTQIEEMPKPPHPRWKPNEGEEYYMIGTCGDVCLQGWTNDDIDNKRLSCGNIFMTREAAEFAAERRKVLTEMQEWAGKWNDTFVLIYLGIDDRVSFSNILMYHNTFSEMRFATKEDAENCIRAVGADRIIKYYFEISREEKK